MYLSYIIWFFFCPSELRIVIPPSCRIHNTTFTQEGCGACAAFALSTAASMHLCLGQGVDRIPSPYRLFDCGGARCGKGSSVTSLYPALGVSDLRDSPQRFGLRCREYTRLDVSSIHQPYALASEYEIKSAMLLSGKPVIGIVKGELWRDIATGIFIHINTQSNHALVIVGWGSSPYPHWVVKNSWGESWGDAGYGRVHTSALISALDLTGEAKHCERLEIWIIASFGVVFPMLAMCSIIVMQFYECWEKLRRHRYREVEQLFDGV